MDDAEQEPQSSVGTRRQAPSSRERAQRGLNAPVVDSAEEDPTSGTGSEQLTWDAAIRRLKSLGIQKYRLESVPGQDSFMFSCTVYPANNSRMTRRFEAEAEEPLLAVQKVLDQVDEWRSR